MSNELFNRNRRDSDEEKMKKSSPLKISIIIGLLMIIAAIIYMIVRLKDSEIGNYFIVPAVIIGVIIVLVYLFQYRNLFKKE